MTSLASARIGAQRPRLLHLPPRDRANPEDSSGYAAIELAESAGLILDEWQQWCLIEGLREVAATGQWAAFEVAIIVARQNGKGSILEALELAALFLFEMRLIVHSAHEFKTAREHFLRMQTLIKGAPELLEQVEYIHTGAGTESIGLRNGARLNFVARSSSSGRGFTGDLIVFDEAFKLPESAIGAMMPALSARPNPQIWYTSSAPHQDSHILHSLLQRAREGDAGRLFLAEWGNDADVDWHDPAARREAMYASNPGAGIRITEEHTESEYQAMKHLGDEFLRERLGVPSAEDSGSGVFGPGQWQACCDESSQIGGAPRIALDVAPGMAFASFGAAGTRSDGLLHVELVERAPGTGWVIPKAKELGEKYGPVLVDPRSAAGGLLKDFREAGVPFEEIGDGEMARGCAAIQEKVHQGTLRHIGQGPLDQAVAGAAIKVAGDSWRWSRSGSTVDISPLVAVTLAALRTGGAQVTAIII